LIGYTEYDLEGKNLVQHVDLGCDHILDFQYDYRYTGWGNLNKVYGSFDNQGGTGNPLVTYNVQPWNNKLRSTEYFTPWSGTSNVDAIGNEYDIQDRLTQINSRLFTIDYRYDNKHFNFQGVNPINYQNESVNYNGNINASLARYSFGSITNSNSISQFTSRTLYGYKYDGINRLIEGNYSEVSSTDDVVVNYSTQGEETYVYDRIGNFVQQSRYTFDAPPVLEQMNYSYSKGTNRLIYIDANNYYTYDPNGNTIRSSKLNILNSTYGRANLPFNLTLNTTDVTEEKYLYNSNDARIYKYGLNQNGGVNNNEFYLYDFAGRQLAIGDLQSNKWDFYLYGYNRFAKIDLEDSQQPQMNNIDIGYYNVNSESNAQNKKIIDGLREAAILGDTLKGDFLQVSYTYSGVDTTRWMFKSRMKRLEILEGWTNVAVGGSIFIASEEESLVPLIDVINGGDIQVTLGEILAGTDRKTAGGATYLFDPFDVPYIIKSYHDLPPIQFYVYDHLGNTRVTYIPELSSIVKYNIMGAYDYSPFGRLIRSYSYGEVEKYLTTQHERDKETSLDYRNARFYDSDNGRFLSVDPMAHKREWFSPYNYCQNNPIIRVDPTGALDSPIYDEGGNFLGTDDEGLQGEAIIMNEDNFTQGMSHSDAMANGNTLDNMSIEQATKFANNGNFENFLNHYNNLPNRIDYSSSFVLTKEVADKHWQGKSGKSLFVNAANIDLPGVTTKDFNSQGFYSKNFIWGMSNTGKVFGTLDMTLLDPKTGSVMLGYRNPDVSPNGLVLDSYDFTSDGRIMRDLATWVGKPSGTGKAFDIHGYGTSKVPVK
jgi:RHS repeat-associated protein